MEPMKPMAPMKPLEKMTAAERWWPDDLGEPNSSGSANDTRYAFFAAKHRLVLQKGGKVRLLTPARPGSAASTSRRAARTRSASRATTDRWGSMH